MKTPEELAEEYADSGLYRLKRYVDGRIKPAQGQLGLQHLACRYGFRAGYQAAKDQLDTAIASRDAWKEDAERYAESADYWKAQAAAPQWISVKDRLPELMSRCENRSYSDDVLWLTKTGEMVVGNCRKVNEHISVLIPVGEPLITNFTHWMPLPKPPEE